MSDVIAPPAVSVLDPFQVTLLESLKPYMEQVRFSPSEVLIERGSVSDAF